MSEKRWVRREAGVIVAAFGVRQEGYDDEEVAADDPGLAAFRAEAKTRRAAPAPLDAVIAELVDLRKSLPGTLATPEFAGLAEKTRPARKP